MSKSREISPNLGTAIWPSPVNHKTDHGPALLISFFRRGSEVGIQTEAAEIDSAAFDGIRRSAESTLGRGRGEGGSAAALAALRIHEATKSVSADNAFCFAAVMLAQDCL